MQTGPQILIPPECWCHRYAPPPWFPILIRLGDFGWVCPAGSNQSNGDTVEVVGMNTPFCKQWNLVEMWEFIIIHMVLIKVEAEGFEDFCSALMTSSLEKDTPASSEMPDGGESFCSFPGHLSANFTFRFFWTHSGYFPVLVFVQSHVKLKMNQSLVSLLLYVRRADPYLGERIPLLEKASLGYKFFLGIFWG